jgi:tryptophanyl-tRNA synthetase
MSHKETIVGGIRPTNKLHIGNYLGALKQFVEVSQDPTKTSYFFIVDLHALTTPFEPKEIGHNTLDALATYLACGFDTKNSTLFVQSHVPEHTELTWIFNCITPIGELERMTQFKEKSQQHATNINAGLFSYPVLMAADILLYKPQGVSVGEDQVQHVELSRTIARKFNAKFGKVFPEPKPFMQKPLRIMSLKDPEKKMSKTGDEALFLDDSPEEIKRKIKKAVTATDANGTSAGVQNLLFLLSHFGSKEQNTHFADEIQSNTIKFSELKEVLADSIADYFAEFREKKQQYLRNKMLLAEILADGAHKARTTAQATLAEVKEKIGLL